MTNKIPTDWTECEEYRGWVICIKHYNSAVYKGFRAGAQTAGYRSRADARLAIDATEDAYA